MSVGMLGWPQTAGNAAWPSEPQNLLPGRPQGWPRGTQATANDAERLLSQAVGWWDAAWYTPGDRFLRNRGVAGELLDMRLGSSLAANSNDPLYLAPDSDAYAYLTGNSRACLSIEPVVGKYAGDVMDIRGDVALDAYTSGSNLDIAAKDGAWYFAVLAAGSMALTVKSASGDASVTSTAKISSLVASKQRVRLRATYTRDTGGGQYEVAFYYSLAFDEDLSTATTWTLLETAKTGSSVGATSNPSNRVTWGAYTVVAGSSPGRYYAACVSINGTVEASYTFSGVSADVTTFTASTGQTVTVWKDYSFGNRKTVIMRPRGSGGVPVFAIGSDDYLECLGNWQHAALSPALPQSFTCIIACRQFGNIGSNGRLVSKYDSSGGGGWAMANIGTDTQSSTAVISDGTTSTTSASSTSANGVLRIYRLTYDGRQVVSGLNATTATPSNANANVTNTLPVRIGRESGSSGNYGNLEFHAAAVFRRALTAAEVTTLSNYFTNRGF